MSHRENISYLVPRDPSIKCWDDRVKLPVPCTKNLIQLGIDEFEETMGDKIKVYLRLKPSSIDNSPYTVLNFNTLQTEAPKDSVSYKNVTNGVGKLIHKFTFTSILDQNITQASLFKKCVVNSQKKFLYGENYLLMAYGTTSAGKTYTMQGNVENPGVIPRALDFVFTALKDNVIQICRYQPFQYNELLILSDEQLRKDSTYKNFILSLDLTKCQRYPDASHITQQTTSSSGFSDLYENITFKGMQTNLTDTEGYELNSDSFKYSVWISMIEIYNEQVYDLLEIPNDKEMRPKLTFREDEYGNTFVKNLRYVNVSSGHEAFQILQFGRNNLHMAPTALNERSSRSHCIFMITLAKFLDYDSTSEAVISRYSFCDLAGMERAKKTLNVKDRLVESKAINTSLSILVKCLTTIKENQNTKEKKMIPYRESKLTKLFRDAIMGKEQFSLIVNITSEPNLFDETLNVLKFSSIAQKIVPQNVFAKPKIPKVIKRSRFSRIVANSTNITKTIDWEASTVADIKLKEENANEKKVEELKYLVESLQEELTLERKRSQEIEAEIRAELTTKFSEILKQQYETHKKRLENETESLQEMYERKEKRIITYYELLSKNKRQKLEEDDYSDYKDQAEKLKEVEKEVEFLTLENEALKQRVQKMAEESKREVRESSELMFRIAEKDRMLELLRKANEANEAGGDELVSELRKQLEEANTKISVWFEMLKDLKSLLNEAASDYKELEEVNKYLRNENEILEEHLAEHREMVSDLRNEVTELQKLLSQKRILIEKLEEVQEINNQQSKTGKELETIKSEEVQLNLCNKELEILRGQFKKTLEKLKDSREEFEALHAEKLNLEKDLEISKLKVADLQSKILSLEDSQKILEEKISELREEVEKLKNCRLEVETITKEKQVLEKKCNELNEEINMLQKELKQMITSSKAENEKMQEIETLTKENKTIEKELVTTKARNLTLEEELKAQIEKERELKVAFESLKVKFDAVEYQNMVMKNLKDEAERQAFEVPQLHEEIKRLEKEIENREMDLIAFNENRQHIFNNYEKEVSKLKEENERLRKDVLFANEVIAKNMTPLKSDKAEINRLKESVKKKDEEISKLKAEMGSIKKETNEEKVNRNNFKKVFVSDSSSGKEDSPFISIKKKNRKGDSTPERLTKQIEALSLQPTEGKSTRKKVDQLDETIHPSTVKNANKGKRRNCKKEKETEKITECEKENIPIKKKSKCYKQLFTENDFDGLQDLNASPLDQEIPRLRPRK